MKPVAVGTRCARACAADALVAIARSVDPAETWRLVFSAQSVFVAGSVFELADANLRRLLPSHPSFGKPGRKPQYVQYCEEASAMIAAGWKRPAAIGRAARHAASDGKSRDGAARAIRRALENKPGTLAISPPRTVILSGA